MAPLTSASLQMRRPLWTLNISNEPAFLIENVRVVVAFLGHASMSAAGIVAPVVEFATTGLPAPIVTKFTFVGNLGLAGFLMISIVRIGR